MKRILRLPKIQMFFFLLVIYFSAAVYQMSLSLILSLILILLATLALDLFFLKIRKLDFFLPSAALVTASIISLTNTPRNSLFELLLIIFIAVFAKQFLRIDNRHIFNPAALGLFVGGIIFKTNISWWAVSFQEFRFGNLESVIYFIMLLFPAYVSVYRMRRYGIIIPFFLTYVIFNFLFLKNPILFDPTVIFFSLVMLPEPMTSPNKRLRQVLFGIAVASMAVLISLPVSYFGFRIGELIPDPLIVSLLMGNLLFFKFR